MFIGQSGILYNFRIKGGDGGGGICLREKYFIEKCCVVAGGRNVVEVGWCCGDRISKDLTELLNSRQPIFSRLGSTKINKLQVI